MSVTFGCDVRRRAAAHLEPCLCAQSIHGYGDAILEYRACFASGLAPAAELVADLRAHADPSCRQCRGSGVELVPGEDEADFNLANENARALLAALGVGSGAVDDLIGELALPEARRAIMRARNVRLDHLTRPARVTAGWPRVLEDGTVVLQTTRASSPEFTVDDLLDRVDRFAALVDEAGRRGATRIVWG